MVYISRNTSGLYLSEKALKDLKVVHKDFPKSQETTSALIKQELTRAACGCLVHSEVPDHPSEIPFAPTDENREALEKWILSYYELSAFNTCTHQSLQTMTGKPLDIVFKGTVCHQQCIAQFRCPSLEESGQERAG